MSDKHYPHARPCPKCGSSIYIGEGLDETTGGDRFISYWAHCNNCDWDLDDYPYYGAWVMWNILGESSYKDERSYEEDDVFQYHSSR